MSRSRQNPSPAQTGQERQSVRLDKWLWAARFFKTRSLARTAIEGGKVRYNGCRPKPGKSVIPGATIVLRRGMEEITLRVTGISDRRGSATMAATLFQETPESLQQRQAAALLRKAAGAGLTPGNRPDKRQRRQIRDFQEKH